MPRRLYFPKKYRVEVGQGTAGFCTAWSDPDLAIRQAPDLLKSSAVIGTLYSREGVNVLLRNLALNPDIRYLAIWGKSPLSQTPFGRAGTDILNLLWQNGFDESKKVEGANFRLHQEFDSETIRSVIKNVELVDLSREDLDGAVKKLSSLQPRPAYMEPKEFPEHTPDESQPFPSEQVGFLTRGKTIFDAWTRVVDRIMRYGIIKETEYGNKQRELIAVQWVVEEELTVHPYFPADLPAEIATLIGANAAAIERYYPEFLSGDLPPGIAYTYGQRLWAYGIESGNPVSQIGKIIEHLKESAVTRRAVATTWNQYIDSDKATKNPPCFVLMQAIQTEGKMHLMATFRSHDIFKAAIPNAFGLRRLQERIASEAGFDIGRLSIVSNSAHIYEEDWDNAKKMVQCAIWDHPVGVSFNQDADADPRAVVYVRLRDGFIVAEIANSEGAKLLDIEGRTAKQVYKKMAFLDLLSRSDHLMDVAAELQKAEIARDMGIEYVQDQPLRLSQRDNAS